MTGLKESIMKYMEGYPDLLEIFPKWAESYIEELEQHMQVKRPPYTSAEMNAAYNDCLNILSRFLRGES